MTPREEKALDIIIAVMVTILIAARFYGAAAGIFTYALLQRMTIR